MLANLKKKLIQRSGGLKRHNQEEREGLGFVVGKHTFGAEYMSVKQWKHSTSLSIGSFCSIADNITVFLGGNHRIDWVSTYPFPEFHEEWRNSEGIKNYQATKGNVVVKNDVWIGSGASILSGVTIGNGAVVAANSVVTKDIAPYEVVGGNPAKHMKYRFSQHQIRELLKIAWWEWEDAKIADHIRLLCSDNIDGFIKAANKAKTRKHSKNNG